MSCRPVVTLFRDFAEDRRTSMEIYADHLAGALREMNTASLDIREYRPVLSRACRNLPERGNLRMRTARYFCYSRQARARQGGISHILDHGYAHLMSVLDPARTVITVHDLIPVLAGRGLIRGISRPRRSWLAEWSARYYRRAARIIAISENTKRDLIEHCGCDPERIAVIYFGLDTAFRPVGEEERRRWRARYRIPDDARVVLITGHQYYKNHETCLRVMEVLQRHYGASLRLLRLGEITPQWWRLRQASALRKCIVEIPCLPHKEIPALYGVADCLLFPSWYEGFGLPPLEAMACGTPVVTSNVASLPEAVGNAALMADPDDVQRLAEHLRSVFEDEALRAGMIAKGFEHSQRFCWRKNAASTRLIYENLLETVAA